MMTHAGRLINSPTSLSPITSNYEYPGEAHGFRLRQNKIDSLEKEAAFYKRILKRNAAQ
jgi:hypothetical protein